MAERKKTDSAIMSEDDLALMDKYTEAYNNAYAANDEAGKNAAHDAAEQLRAKYGYSGGENGAGYTKIGDSGEVYKTKQSNYQSPYSDEISELYNKIKNREAFSYDAESDPLYQQYKKSYTEQGQQAMQDTLGQVAARTGGIASSYAGSAAQQAYNGYMGQLADKVPELYQLAYSMYQDDVNADYDRLNALRGLESDDYSRYTDALAQENTLRNYNYGLARDAVEDARYEDETAYERQQDDKEWQYKLAQAAKSASSSSKSATQGTGSKYTWDDVIDYEDGGGDAEDFIAAYYKDLGYSTAAQAKAAYKVYQQQNKVEEPITDVSQLSTAALNIANSISRSNGSVASRAQIIGNALDKGQITEAEADFLLSSIGY